MRRIQVANFDETLAYGGHAGLRKHRLPPMAGAAPGFAPVQAKGAIGNSTAPAVTLTSTPTQGNLLVAGVSSVINATITITGWTGLTAAAVGGGTPHAIRLLWKIAGVSESATVTAAAGSGVWNISVSEYSADAGAVISTPTENSQTNASSTAQPTPSVTPPATLSALVVCYSYVRQASTTWSNEQINASTTGVNVRDTEASTGVASSVMYDSFIASTTGSYSGQATASSTGAVGAGAIAVFVERIPNVLFVAHRQPPNHYKPPQRGRF